MYSTSFSFSRFFLRDCVEGRFATRFDILSASRQRKEKGRSWTDLEGPTGRGRQGLKNKKVFRDKDQGEEASCHGPIRPLMQAGRTSMAEKGKLRRNPERLGLGSTTWANQQRTALRTQAVHGRTAPGAYAVHEGPHRGQVRSTEGPHLQGLRSQGRRSLYKSQSLPSCVLVVL